MKKITLFLIAGFLINTVSRAQVTLPGTWAAVGAGTSFNTISMDLDFGDGVSDGALRVLSSSAGVGKGATYTFGGTMVDGITYTIDTNVGNFSINFVKFKVSLYDVTAAAELVTTAEFNLNNTANLSGAGINLAYTATAGTSGHVLQLKYIRTDTGETSRSFYIDNAKLNSTLINPAITTTIWDGSSWSNGTPIYGAASSTTAVIISGNYSENISFTASNLTIKNSAAVRLVGGKVMNLFGPITVESGSSLTLSSNSNLLQTNVANSGNVTVERSSNSLNYLDYTIWSSPVTNASQNLLDFSPLTLPTRFYTYNTNTNFYNAVASPSTTPFAKGAGYLIRMPDTDAAYPGPLTYSGSFTGVPNSGDVSVSLNYVDATHGYNMVGNPYPSPINAAAFLTANSANIESTLYFWRKTNGAGGSAYATYTAGGATTTTPTSAVPSGKIAVGQGFFVQAKSAITVPNFFTNAMRLQDIGTPFFKTKQVAANDQVWLNLTNAAGAFSQTLVSYIDGASQGADDFDGKYINDSPLALTSNINGGEYTIQGRPAFDATDVVTLNFKTDKVGDYTIAIDHTNGVFATGQDVYLIDNTTGTETNLKTDAYTFSAAKDENSARFSLKYQKTLNVNSLTFNENNLTVYSKNGVLYVHSGANTIQNIKVYDIQGRLLLEQNNVKSNTATVDNLAATNQALIVQVTSENNIVVSKKVLN